MLCIQIRAIFSCNVNPKEINENENPVIFVIGFNGPQEIFTSTSISRNGTFVSTGMDPERYSLITKRFPCGILVSIYTDDEKAVGKTINNWIKQECAKWRGKREVQLKCFIYTEFDAYHSYEFFSSPNFDQLADVIKNRRAITRLKHTEESLLHYSLVTDQPTTASPVISPICEHRQTPEECNDDKCSYITDFFGCKPIDWCRFKSTGGCKLKKNCDWNEVTRECVVHHALMNPNRNRRRIPPHK